MGILQARALQWEDGGGVGDVEYLSPHGYIRNTPSDTEVHAEHQLRADRRTRPEEGIYRTMQNSGG